MNDTARISSRDTTRRPRKFSIQSQFGQARTRRSRKNRPCDACRRRKTACVISTEPPCLFCKSRGLTCQSLPGPANALSDPAGAPRKGLSDGAARAVPIGETSRRPLLVDSSRVDQISVALGPATANQHQNPGSASVVHDGLVRQSLPSAINPNSGLLSNDSRGTAAAVHALEDIGNKTAHSMGLAAEQDSYLLDAFRSVIMSENDEIDANIIQVSRGGPHPDKRPTHFLILQNEFPEHTNRAMQEASNAIETTVWPHGLNLVRLYFRYVHPAYPVVSKGRFLRQYATAKEQIPASLRGAVYALACSFWQHDPSLCNPPPFAQHELLNHAHLSLRRELEAPNLAKLQACLLLLHERPPDIDSVESPSTWILTAQAVACAQMIGLHKEPMGWSIAPWEKSLRKKLWWATYAADCWSSVCHGNPPHICVSSFDTSSLDMDTIRFDEDVPQDLYHLVDSRDTSFRVVDGARFFETVKVAQYLRNILD
ncbi:hypothetical protein BBP40_012064, partial [Aspergillus hancockii]